MAGRVPRSALFLTLALVIAAGSLWLLRDRSSVGDGVLGGLLYPEEVTLDKVEGMLLTRAGAQYRFDRGADGIWRSGGALDDFIDSQALNNLLNEVLGANGGALLPGTEPDDRRYEFTGPDGIRLTLLTAGGQRHSLSVGASNPVTGTYYASGLGRPGCFPVTAVLRESLTKLPGSIRLKSLLPHFERTVVHEVRLVYPGEEVLLRRLGDRWWVREPEAGLTGLDPILRAYDRHHDDRRRLEDGRAWRLAGKSVIWQLIYECSEVKISRIPGAGLLPRDLADWGLDPAWRTVVLQGPAINPDSTEARGDELVLGFGTPLEGGEVPTLRRGNVLLAESEAAGLLRGALTDLLEVGALTREVARADSLRMWREGTLILAGRRGPEPAVQGQAQRRPPVESWLTTYPPREARSDLRELSYTNLVRNMITNLDRLEVLGVFAPVDQPDILSEKEKVTLEIFREGGVQRLEVGYLLEDRLPPGQPGPVASPDGQAPVSLWDPSTGQLLQIPGHLIVTLRNQQTLLKD